ncbi:hypothetical protein AMTRI_Chr08g207640 [Amborella trichopoda]
MENINQALIVSEVQEDAPIRPLLLNYLYVGHFLARWGARMWEFSVGLYMINVWPDSLLLAAIYGVVETASIALLGSNVGDWVNRMTYKQVLQGWLLTQNFSFMLAGGTVFAVLSCNGLKSTNFPIFMVLVSLINIAGAVGALSTLAGTILVEREWIVVISGSQSSEILTQMNSVIRRIDLTCKLLAPVVTGFLISFISLKASAIAFALWTILSVWLEYWLLSSVYHGTPALIKKSRPEKTAKTNSDDSLSCSLDLEERGDSSSLEQRVHLTGQNEVHTSKRGIMTRLLKLPTIAGWLVYTRQDVLIPGVALSLLYFTVLSFGTLMTATLEWEGIPAYVIGIARGISAMIGISATLLYPILHSHLSSLRTGLWSIWAQWSLLLVSIASLWVQNTYLSAWMLMGGVASSRLGLWMFDLSVIQQMQDSVPEADRCVVGGVQNSLQSMMDLLGYVMGLIISNPKCSCVPRAEAPFSLRQVLKEVPLDEHITLKLEVVELRVGMHCERCIKAIKKAVKKIEDIETYKVDIELKKLTVTGNVTTEEVVRELNKIGKPATEWCDE